MGYSARTLAMVVVAPVIVLTIVTMVTVVILRKLHQNQMQRLNAREAEYGAIDGLIASNVGDSTLAVSISFKISTLFVSRPLLSKALLPLVYC